MATPAPARSYTPLTDAIRQRSHACSDGNSSDGHVGFSISVRYLGASSSAERGNAVKAGGRAGGTTRIPQEFGGYPAVARRVALTAWGPQAPYLRGKEVRRSRSRCSFLARGIVTGWP